ncbi:Prenyltransferase and squalene oxidase repeat-containing protein [Muriicola jejuensis]|uniref:Prenyltransferase alpha-alpha toroid domain-containing protein n=1 Tax=Muriicola jejuensis TaxID=504488 RepID=A0A6P0UCE5_9FLAO|nr:prenyltransferase/squalene oxidase repeat-containing protein [Muriicola jejuensis]NER10160.1 hypothetical protein [Muriicola jejuensis]SMP02614.1 Prenyltransferase and squalene oxidase repeat-containing protein [Muriicola jejuensis]
MDSPDIKKAVNKSLDYLWSRNANGFWEGFPTLAGTSDIWVTGFVLAHISSLTGNTSTRQRTHEFLINARHPQGGWSYSAIVPPDADSTAWCLAALSGQQNLTKDMLKASRTFLWGHYTGKGIATYIPASGIQQFIGAPSEEFMTGWYNAHPDVSIAAVLADIHGIHMPETLDWIAGLPKKDGMIASYWWRSPFYSTALYLRAIKALKKNLSTVDQSILVTTLQRDQMDNGGYGLDDSDTPDIFSAALALECMIYLEKDVLSDNMKACVNYLLSAQNPDGSWEGHLILRLPAPDVLDPETVFSWNNPEGGGNSFIADRAGLFTTTLACHSLALWGEKISASKQ